ncbi:hypothetical protein [Falsiruegeria litorea]|uniref:hypothetical protein n=1 Tax=Falsiruegeria litorea TaxID=1280831 RepID=UPI001BFDE50E|nr:hypothetical protein [Falsiruegeria litorea]MBT8167622.1 hypothetical protein [Falsiruegeria litorea]
MLRPSLSLENKFADALLATCDETAKLGYVADEFASMLKIHGAVQTAKKLVRSGEIQSGLRRLRDLGRLDLATEAVMLQPEFRELFTQQHLDAASWRLDQMKGSK